MHSNRRSMACKLQANTEDYKRETTYFVTPGLARRAIRYCYWQLQQMTYDGVGFVFCLLVCLVLFISVYFYTYCI